MANSLYIDPVTGGYLANGNKLVYVNSVVNKVNYLLKQNQTSDIKLSPNNISKLVSVILSPLQQSLDIQNFSVVNFSVDVLGNWTINIEVTINNNDSNTESVLKFKWTPK